METSLKLDYAELLQRAALFESIADLVKRSEARPFTIVRPPEDEGRELGEVSLGPPRIRVGERRVYCNDRVLDLARRPMMMRLFHAFCMAPGGELSCDRVVKILYGKQVESARSPRYAESLTNNTVKLVSRARILATTFLSQGRESGIEWFVHRPDTRCWSFYQLRGSYFEHPSKQ